MLAAVVVLEVVVVSVPVAEPAFVPVVPVVLVPVVDVAFTGEVLGLVVAVTGAFKLDCVVEVSSLTLCVCETKWGVEIDLNMLRIFESRSYSILYTAHTRSSCC